jgi:UDP-N-acetylmuramoyl-L-alanyl-D-glutamate--2,6-diaminopimelate ligase
MLRKIVKFFIPRKLFRAIEPLGHWGEAVLWQVVEGFPARGLKVIGVTGTDGKTTTSTMIYEMLNDAGIKTGLMTTIGWGTPGKWHDNKVHMTTMQTRPMLRRIKALRREGIEWLVLETTSHALAQHRVWGIGYDVAVMTNVTHEHLDYHGTFERYKAAKVKLFAMVGRRRGGLRVGVVNADDAAAPEFAAALTGLRNQADATPQAQPRTGAAADFAASRKPRVISYGLEKGDLRPTGLELRPDGSDFEVKHDGQTLKLKVHLPGKVNVLDALAAGVGLTLGLKPGQIEHGIDALKNVAGRMVSVDAGQKFAVIVDFAHTPAAFEKTLGMVRELTKGRMIVMFGSAGRRDEAKRAIQGRIAGRVADLVVVTEEDDRDVDGQKIMEQIAGGAEESGKRRGEDLWLVHDRVEAIRRAVGLARPGDTVLLLGKGHETTIERADGEHPWNEVAEARAALKLIS